MSEAIDVCTITKSVVLDISKLDGKELTTENLSRAAPKLIKKDIHEYAVALWNVECASIDPHTSFVLAKLSKLDQVALKITFTVSSGKRNGCVVQIFVASTAEKARFVFELVKNEFRNDQGCLKIHEMVINSLQDNQLNITTASNNTKLSNDSVITSSSFLLPSRISIMSTTSAVAVQSTTIPKLELSKSVTITTTQTIDNQQNSQNYLPVLTMKKLVESNKRSDTKTARSPSCDFDRSIAVDTSGHIEAFDKYTVPDMQNLPSSILEKVNIFSQDAIEIHREKNKLSNLLDDRRGGNICNFLLTKDDTPAAISEDMPLMNASRHIDSDSDDNTSSSAINFSTDFLARRRMRRKGVDVTGHIGNNIDELLEDPSDVSIRNWGLITHGRDPADIMFSEPPPPVVKKNKLDELFDLMSEFRKDEEIDQCDAIETVMMPHQKMALNWMIKKENTTELPPFWECVDEDRDYFNTATCKRLYEKPITVNGGILADDMGLGKTLTTIALILSNHQSSKPLSAGKKILPTAASDLHEGSSDGKLIIKRKREGYTKAKTTTKGDLSKPGFQFRQLYLQQMGKKKKKKKKKKRTKEMTDDDTMFLSSESDDENVNKHVNNVINNSTVFEEPVMKKSKFSDEAKSRRMTLIVCPMSVLSNWTDQFQKHVSSKVDIQIYVYYGGDRVRDVSFLQRHDVIISTYGTVSGDYRSSVTKNRPSPLHKINWLRIVLDEGHIIRNVRSQQTAAMVSLNAKRKWLITGTPIQNRMTDLWSMVKFLRLEPFTNRRWWFEYVVNSMKRQSRHGEEVYNRVQKLIKHIAIRRTKNDQVNGKPIVDLPPRRVVIQKIRFNEDERKMYDAMHKDGKLLVCKYLRLGTVLKNYANVLVIIMRLRQLCCHPNLCMKSVNKLQKALDLMDQLQENMTKEGENDSAEDSTGADISEEEREKLIQQLMQLLNSGDSEECSICLEILQDPVITRCAHVFCSNCINDVLEADGLAPVCPLCRGEIDKASMLRLPETSKYEEEEQNDSATKALNSDLGTDHDDILIPSSKVNAVMDALIMQRQNDPSIKSLVVSQFTSFLDVLQKPLAREGFSFARLDGKMSQGARAQVIEDFNKIDDLSPSIMLLSLTAGGVGLNLTAANRVFLLDPAWNPAVEEQCFDRAHRLGQKKEVLVIKFIVENTVEDRMLVLQQQKRDLMQKAFGMRTQTPEERRATALRDIATLLGINIPRYAPPE